MHGTAFLAAIVVAVLGVLFALSDARLSARIGTESTVTIGVEHLRAAELTLSISNGKGPGLAEFRHDGSETLLLSTPAAWELREVRGGTLENVPADPAAFGYRRWKLPPNVTLSLSIPSSPDAFEIHNPTSVPLQFTLRRIDLAQNAVALNVHLIQQSPVTIR